MPDQQKIEQFSAEKRRFFNLFSKEGMHSSTAQLRNRVKYRYDLEFMPVRGDVLFKRINYI